MVKCLLGDYVSNENNTYVGVIPTDFQDGLLCTLMNRASLPYILKPILFPNFEKFLLKNYNRRN